ncbi:MAG: DHH family phosphoesterase [Nanoarchaeota archaeon]|nr:DHH family phosphoesterase [Nanoarchaeota archaeon]
MKSVENITKQLERHRNDRPNNSGFIDDLIKGRDWMYNIVTKYEKDKIINISDSKDADGFGSQIIIHKGLECILDFLGNQFVEVESDRLGRFSKDETNPEHIKNIVEIMGKGKYIISDLATLRPEDANKHLDDLLFVDHHPNKTGFSDRFVTVNPQEHDINGAKELSSAMNATLMINILYDKLEEEYGNDKQNKKGLIKLREQLNYLSIFGLAGSKADQQDDRGLNKILYDYLRLNNLIEKTDSPFYGHNTKEAAKVWAQSNPFYNFRYSVPNSKMELNRIISRTGLNPSKNRDSLISKIFNEFRWAFVSNGITGTSNQFSHNTYENINIPYLEGLDTKKIKKLNELVKELTGQELVKECNIEETGERTISALAPFKESNYNHFTDNISEMPPRIELAKQYLNNMDFDGEEVIANQVGLVEKLKQLFSDNLKAFGNPKDLEFSLNKLKKGQYLSKSVLPMVDTSIAEIANMMTSMSKQDCGPIMLEAIDEVLDNSYTSKISSGKSKILIVYEKNELYKYMVYEGMGVVSNTLINGEITIDIEYGIRKNQNIKLGENMYYSNFDFLSQAMGPQMDIRKMNGVCAGIACNTNLLPGGNVMFFTGVTYDETINNEKQEWIKISGRATESPQFDEAKINQLMFEFDGGGHRTAAACSIPQEKLPEFLEKARTFDYFA